MMLLVLFRPELTCRSEKYPMTGSTKVELQETSVRHRWGTCEYTVKLKITSFDFLREDLMDRNGSLDLSNRQCPIRAGGRIVEDLRTLFVC